MKRASVPTDIFKTPGFTRDRNGRYHDTLGRFVSSAAVMGHAALQRVLFDGVKPGDATDVGGVFAQGIPSPAAETTTPQDLLPRDELWLTLPSRQQAAALHMAAAVLAA